MNRHAPRLLVIINHAAGRARRAWPQIKNTLQAKGIRFDEHATTHAGDATTKTRAALREGYNIIAVVGGDGTLSEAASGFFDFDEGSTEASNILPHSINADAALALLPAGTGNDFARGLLAGKLEPLEFWIERLIASCQHHDERTSRVVDLLYGKADAGGQHNPSSLSTPRPSASAHKRRDVSQRNAASLQDSPAKRASLPPPAAHSSPGANVPSASPST